MKKNKKISYAGGTLAHLMASASLDLDRILLLAIHIADVLDSIHRDKRFYGCLNPAMIELNPETWQVVLPETEWPREAVASLDIVSLRYISPEQTERMNRRVDYRTDVYSLGMVFYELLTGNPPYISEDPLEIIHSHIAQRPIPPNKLEAEVPEQVSAIVMRLLEKNAEDRYQSALGLRHDLERCFEELNKTGTIKTFKLGKLDYTGIFQIPQKL